MSKTEIFEKIKNQKMIEVQVKTNANKTELVQKEDKLILSVKSLPEDNKANEEIIKFLKKNTGKIPKIISGATSRKKLIKLE